MQGWVLSSIAVAVLAAGCNGCIDDAGARFDDWLRSPSDRPGKVGTLQALKVGETARRNAVDRLRRGEGPCRIGWRLDEPFAVDFEFEIRVDDTRRTRRWTEAGSWERDEAGRWLIESDVEFRDGEGIEGTRRRRVFSDTEGFWEWLGPEVVARHPADGPAFRHWKRRYGGRFGDLMTLVSERWGPVEGADDRWEPGGEKRRCGPMVGDEEVADWRPLLEARGSLREARVRSGSRSGTHGEAGPCRRLEATYALRGDTTLELEYRECRRVAGPGPVERPDVGRVTEASRDRARTRVQNRLQEWLEQGLIESTDESDESQ